MNKLSDTFKMNNGVTIDCIGYGTYLTPNEDTCNLVKEAIKIGYRHIDTAFFYQNEQGVGKAIRECGLPREQFFITSKVWNADRGYENTKAAFAKTMSNLGLEYLDLLLIHWPANRKQFGDKAKLINAETWRAFEELYAEGKVKAIGLSNFLPHHIDELMETATVKPMINQIEVHPGWTQREVVDYCQQNDILVEAWSPLGRSALLNHDVLTSIAMKHQKSVAQVCIRWCLQHNILPLPKTVTPSRMIENVDVFDFYLTDEDMKMIDEISDHCGQCALPDEVDF